MMVESICDNRSKWSRGGIEREIEQEEKTKRTEYFGRKCYQWI